LIAPVGVFYKDLNGLTLVVLGGTASQAQSDQCLQTAAPTLDCLTQSPTTKILEGMSTGLVAGTGAGIGATWRMWRQD